MTTSSDQRAALRLQRLFSGALPDGETSSEATAEVLVLPGAGPDPLRDLALDPSSLVVAPEDAGVRPEHVGGAEVLTYEGGVGAEDDLLLDGGLVVSVQPYAAAAFMPVTCPTLVSVTAPEDFEAYVEDADAAVALGAFPDALLHPLTALGDVCALGSEHPCGTPMQTRAVVHPDDTVRPAVGGVPFPAAEPRPSACTGCLGGVAAPEDLDAARAERPWLSRYLNAVETLRLLAGRLDAPAQVSGFGMRLSETLEPVPTEPAAAPMLVQAGEEVLVADPVSRRVLRAGPDAARILEVVLANDGGDPVDAVGRHLGLGGAVARSAVAEVGRTLDELGFPLRVGEPA